MNGRLLIDCPDRPGLVAAVATFLAARDANIVESDQHSTDPSDGEFYLRMVFDLDGDLDALRAEFAADVGERFAMDWRLVDAAARRRVAILVSREPHCLLDLLWRWQRGELDCDVAAVISNHDDHRAAVEAFGATYHHVPATRGTRADAEARLLELLRDRCDLVVLARYMQILIRRVPRARRRTGHQHPPLVPAGLRRRRALPAGPRARREGHRRDRPLRHRGARRGADHRAGRDAREPPLRGRDLARMGADVERLVLARAVRWHLEDRVLVHGNRTVVF